MTDSPSFGFTPLVVSGANGAGIAIDGIEAAADGSTAQLRLAVIGGVVEGLAVAGSGPAWLELETIDAQSHQGILLEVLRRRGNQETLIGTIGSVPQPGSQQLGQAGRQALAVQPGDQLLLVQRNPEGQRLQLLGSQLAGVNGGVAWSRLQLRFQNNADAPSEELVLRARLRREAPSWLSPAAAPQRQAGLPVLALQTGDQLQLDWQNRDGSSSQYGFLRVEPGADGNWVAVNDATGGRMAFADSEEFRRFARAALDRGFSDSHLYTLNDQLDQLHPVAGGMAAAGPGLLIEPLGAALPADQGLKLLGGSQQPSLASAGHRWVALEVQAGQGARTGILLVDLVKGDGSVHRLGGLGGWRPDDRSSLRYGGRLAVELEAGSRLVFSMFDAQGQPQGTALATLAPTIPKRSPRRASRERLGRSHSGSQWRLHRTEQVT